MDYLSRLENQSIYILREAFNKFEHLAMLWSIGKDSTVLLWLARKAFFGHVPFPLVHVDTTYKIPSILDMPEIEVILVEEKNPRNEFGAKGVGESGTINVASAIANAIYDAVGIRVDSLPITPEKILKALQAKG